MRYLFPILLLAASVLLCICAAPSAVSVILPQARISTSSPSVILSAFPASNGAHSRNGTQFFG